MKGLMLCLLAALAACQSTTYEPTLSPKKAYEYKYEGVINIGREMPDLAEAGVKISCTFKIKGMSAETFLLQISDLAFAEFNGVPGKSTFNVSPALTKRLAAELTKPFIFQFVKGKVIDIRAPADVPDTIVNIVRGILGFLQITIKASQRIYEIVELGVHGVCPSTYAIEEIANSKDLLVTQVVDINNCKEKAALTTGIALAVPNKISKQRGDNTVAIMKSSYTVKSTEHGGLITKAYTMEHQYFSPFNVKGGSSKMRAIRDIELIRVTDTSETHFTGHVQSKGDLVYKFGTELKQIPLLLRKVDNPVPKIAELIQRMAKANSYQVDTATTEDGLELCLLLRMTTLNDLEDLWKQLAGNDEHRRWFLDSIIEVTDERVIKFLLNRFRAGVLSPNEAGQTLLMAINHLTVSTTLVEMAQEFLTIPFSRSHPILWNTVALAYGSLVYKLCAYVESCPVPAVQPLLDMAANGLAKNSMDDMVIALKAIGNAGHPSSIKTIIKFLPGISPQADNLPTRVHSAAVQSLRHIAQREPVKVQDIVLSLFVQKNLPSEIRILAFMILMETKPSLALVSTVTAFLLRETDVQVASFSFSFVKGLAKSRTPDNHYLSTACNFALRILEPKLGRLGFLNSKAIYMDWFRDEFLVGTSTEFYMLRNAAEVIPTAVMTKGRFHFIGRILQLLEVGFRAEGLKDLFTQVVGDKEISGADARSIMKILTYLQSIPKDKTLISAYSRAFGQEWFYADLNRDVLQSIIKAFSPSAGKESPVWKMIEDLGKGLAWHWTKPLFVFETRFIQATCLGLPVEISKYYFTVTAITNNAKVAINPPMKEHLRELLTSEVTVETDGYIGVTKDHFVFHGINTNFFQCGAEFKSKTNIGFPWKFTLKTDVKENKYSIALPPCKQKTEFFSVNFDVYAVSRNIEEPASDKMTPMIPEPKVGSLEIYHPKSKMCAVANLYGTAMCVEAEAKRVHYAVEYPLFYFLGYSHFAYRLEPVKTDKPVERILFELNMGTRRHLPNFEKMADIIKKIFEKAEGFLNKNGLSNSNETSPVVSVSEIFNSAPDRMFMMKALAFMTGAKPEGYEGTAYFIPAAQKNEMELVVSQVGEEANWKMCTDANLDKTLKDAMVRLKWGAECQSYDVTVRASRTEESAANPSIFAKLNWGNVPKYLNNLGKSIEEYIPGISFLLGFRQKHEANPARQVTATVVATSPEAFDIKVKMPQLTVYREGICYPFPVVKPGIGNHSLLYLEENEH